MAFDAGRSFEFVVLGLTGAALLFIAMEDLCRYRIRNDAVLALALLFVAFCAVRGEWRILAFHAAVAGTLSLLLVGVYALGWMGGGDIKLLAVAFLWVGASGATTFSLLLSAFAAAYALIARFGWVPSRPQGGRRQVPFGPAICAAMVAALVLGT